MTSGCGPAWTVSPDLCPRSLYSLHFSARKYPNYLIDNEARASANGLPDPKDIPVVVEALAHQPKSSPTRDRVVNCTSSSSWVNPTFRGDGPQYPIMHSFGTSKKKRSFDPLKALLGVPCLHSGSTVRSSLLSRMAIINDAFISNLDNPPNCEYLQGSLPEAARL